MNASDVPTRDHIRRERRSRRRRQRIAAVSSALGAVAILASAGGVLTTSAALIDSGTLRMQLHSEFSVGVIETDGHTVIRPDTRIDGSFPTARLIPGGTSDMTITVFNNSPKIPAALEIVPTITSDVPELLRVSARWTDADGSDVLFGDPDHPDRGIPIADLATTEVALDPRGSAGLADGAEWAGPAASRGTLTLTLHMLDNAASRTHRSGTTTTDLVITAVAR
ncbi:hypothetical protein [Homoserinibacter sp. GY 40078]|uniref:hypothetical protein n=1 Tax=Homoserinibacter sp. GY 40078 TaxID=2603275 RepID=UPI00164F8A53|nr:hypothetical protein [Homoserinibacter sp. GY 40078]